MGVGGVDSRQVDHIVALQPLSNGTGTSGELVETLRTTDTHTTSVGISEELAVEAGVDAATTASAGLPGGLGASVEVSVMSRVAKRHGSNMANANERSLAVEITTRLIVDPGQKGLRRYAAFAGIRTFSGKYEMMRCEQRAPEGTGPPRWYSLGWAPFRTYNPWYYRGIARCDGTDEHPPNEFEVIACDMAY